MGYRQIPLSKGVMGLRVKPQLLAGAFLFSISIIDSRSGGFNNAYLVLFVCVTGVWGLTMCFAGVFCGWVG